MAINFPLLCLQCFSVVTARAGQTAQSDGVFYSLFLIFINHEK